MDVLSQNTGENTGIVPRHGGGRIHPWKRGQSGNPGGRPRKIANALDRALNRHNTKRIAYAVIGEAAAGNVRAFEAIRDTVEGKPAQVITGVDGGPILLSHRFELALQRINETAIDCAVDNGDSDE